MTHPIPPKTSKSQTAADNRFGIDDHEPIGEGASGPTYRGWIKKADGQVTPAALKYSSFPDDPKYSTLHSARREYVQFGSLKHPNIVNYLLFFLDQGSRPVIATEFVPGVTLQHYADDIAGQGLNNGPDWLAQVLNWCFYICGALVYLEQCGVVHRDIKPGNIMIHEKTNEPVLIDFGVGKNTLRMVGVRTTGGRGSYVGTIQFAAPEQFRGSSTTTGEGMPESSADIYSLGVTLAYALDPQSLGPADRDPKSLADFEARRPQMDQCVWPEVTDLVNRMTQVAARDRPNAMEVRHLCADIMESMGYQRPAENAGLTDAPPPPKGELPEFAPVINEIEAATSLLSRNAVACYSDKDTYIDLFSGDTTARCSYDRAREIVRLIDKEHGLPELEYRLATSDEWFAAAGRPKDDRLLGRQDSVFENLEQIELEWLADTIGNAGPECKKVAYLDARQNPVLDDRHRDWPKGVVRLIRAPRKNPKTTT